MTLRRRQKRFELATAGQQATTERYEGLGGKQMPSLGQRYQSAGKTCGEHGTSTYHASLHKRCGSSRQAWTSSRWRRIL